jgi:hypothetical protein
MVPGATELVAVAGSYGNRRGFMGCMSHPKAAMLNSSSPYMLAIVLGSSTYPRHADMLGGARSGQGRTFFFFFVSPLVRI